MTGLYLQHPPYTGKQGIDLCRCLAVRLVFVHTAPVNDGVTVRRALLQHGRKHCEALPHKGCPRFLSQLAAWRGIDDNGGGRLGKSGNRGGGTYGLEIKAGVPARNQDKIGQLSRDGGGTVGMGGR